MVWIHTSQQRATEAMTALLLQISGDIFWPTSVLQYEREGLFSNALDLKSLLLRKTPQNCGAWSSGVGATSKQHRLFQRARSKAHCRKIEMSLSKAPPSELRAPWADRKLLVSVSLQPGRAVPTAASFGWLGRSTKLRVWVNQPTLEQVPIELAPKFQEEGMKSRFYDSPAAWSIGVFPVLEL